MTNGRLLAMKSRAADIGEHLFSILPAEVTGLQTVWQNFFCALTERSLLLFSQKTATLSKRFSWLEISNILFSEGAISFVTDSCTIQVSGSANLDTARQKLEHVLCHLFTAAELSQFTSLPHITPILSDYGAFCRFSEERSRLNPGDADLLAHILTYRRSTVSLADFTDPLTVFDVLLPVLQLANGLQSLSLVRLPPEKTRDCLDRFSQVRTQLSHLIVQGDFPDNFLTNLATSELLGIGFQNLTVRESLPGSIRSFVSTRQLKAIEFDDVPISIIHSVFDGSSPSHLVSVSLTQIFGLRLDSLVSSIPSVRFLSLANCSLDIGAVLSCLTKHAGLAAIDLSGNLVSNLPRFALPDKLRAVIMDDIHTRSESIVSLIKFLVSNLPDQSTLSVSRLKTSTQVWASLYAAIGGIQSKLSNLKWDSNKISAGFTDFLDQQCGLEVLSVNRCFEASQANLFDRLCAFVAQSQSLRRLECRGGEHGSLGACLPRLIRAVSDGGCLEHLDISDYPGTETVFPVLQAFVRDFAPLKVLVFDGLGPMFGLASFLRFAAAQGVARKLSFPSRDFGKLAAMGRVSPADSAAILDLFREGSGAEYVRPFHIFEDDSDVQKPFWLTSAGERLLASGQSRPVPARANGREQKPAKAAYVPPKPEQKAAVVTPKQKRYLDAPRRTPPPSPPETAPVNAKLSPTPPEIATVNAKRSPTPTETVTAKAIQSPSSAQKAQVTFGTTPQADKPVPPAAKAEPPARPIASVKSEPSLRLSAVVSEDEAGPPPAPRPVANEKRDVARSPVRSPRAEDFPPGSFVPDALFEQVRDSGLVAPRPGQSQRGRTAHHVLRLPPFRMQVAEFVVKQRPNEDISDSLRLPVGPDLTQKNLRAGTTIRPKMTGP
jgi:hypothetical protein